MKKQLITFLLLVLGIGVIAGCGYTTSGALAPNHRTIYIPAFENQVNFSDETGDPNYFPLLEVKTHNAIVDRFLFEGHLRVVRPDVADLVLTGILKNYEKRAIRYTDDEDVQEYRVYVTVELILTDRVSGEVVWSEPSFTGEGTYLLEGAVSASVARSEEAALEEAVEDLARRVVERTVEKW